jgi:alpha-N-arabinofuranosidase
MYAVHQDATSLPAELISPNYSDGGGTIKAVTASASRDNSGKVHISLTNADADRPVHLSCQFAGLSAKSVSGRVLTAPAINSHNSFDAPDAVQPQPLVGAIIENGILSVTIPAKSVVVLELF